MSMLGMRQRWIAVMVGVMLACAPRPASAAEVATTEQLRRWFVGLMDPDPATREKSRFALLGLRRGELQTLAAVAQEYAPLEPTAVEVMREVVEHVYLSDESYVSEDLGFLGIQMPPQIDVPGKLEVVVESRMPGFAGFRMFQDGDVILDIVERPLKQPVERRAFCDKVREIRPGELVHFKVLRRGKRITVPIRLDPRPRDQTGGLDYEGQVQQLQAHRSAEAEAYWRKLYGPLVDARAVEKTAAGE